MLRYESHNPSADIHLDSSLHSCRFLVWTCVVAMSASVHSLMLSTHVFFCLPLLLPVPSTVSWTMAFANPDNLVMWPYHCNFLLAIASSPYGLEMKWKQRLNHWRMEKAPEIDNIPLELIWQGGAPSIDMQNEICYKIWQTGQCSSTWTQKKGNLRQWQNDSAISLIRHPG